MTVSKPTSFTGEIAQTFNYNKHPHIKHGRHTGWSLAINTSPYTVVDFDIHGNDEQKETIRSYFDIVIETVNVKVVKTMSGGFHFYTKWDSSFIPTKDSYEHVYKFVDEDGSDSPGDFCVDVFVPYAKEGVKSRGIMLPGSHAKNKLGEFGTYELIKDVTDDELISYSEFIQLLADEFGFEFPPLENSKVEPSVDELKDVLNYDVSALFDENEIAETKSYADDIMTKELFATLVAGIDRNIEIHNDLGKETYTHLSIFHVYCALAACVNDEITDGDVDAALDYVSEHAKLSDTASATWEARIARYKARDMRAKHPGLLYSIVKKFNPEYYELAVKPIIARRYREKRIADLKNEFVNGRYTISDYLAKMHTFTTIDEYIDNLVRCLAFIDNGKYIIKEKDEQRVKYTVINKEDLKAYINFDGEVEEQEVITEEMVKKWKEQHRKVLGEVGDVITHKVNVNLLSLLRRVQFRMRFKRFEKVALIGNDDNVFGLYRPPRPNDYYVKIENKPELVQKFFALVEDQLFDEHAKASWNHFINTNAYLLQQRKKSSVFFVKYGETGNSGKNFIDNQFSKLYEGFTLNGITEQQMNEKHNGGMVGMLYRAYDEFDNSAYQDKSINNTVKRLTNDKMAGRAMGRDTKEEKDYSIDVLNTNDAGVYGLLKGGQAVLTRLCIIRMKERDIKESEYYKDINAVDDINFPFSLYTYLMGLPLNEFIAKSKFNRYDLNETNIIAKQLLEVKHSLFDDFLDSIADRFTVKKYKGVDVEYITCEDFTFRYDWFMRNNKYKQGSTSITNELTLRGFTKKRFRVGEGLPYVYYRQCVVKKSDDKTKDENVVDYEKFDDDEDESPVKASI